MEFYIQITIQRKKFQLYAWDWKLAQIFCTFTRSLPSKGRDTTSRYDRVPPHTPFQFITHHPSQLFNASVLLTSLNKGKHTVSTQISFIQARRSQVLCLLRFPSHILTTLTVSDQQHTLPQLNTLKYHSRNTKHSLR
jgi:hypothetical protein